MNNSSMPNVFMVFIILLSLFACSDENGEVSDNTESYVVLKKTNDPVGHKQAEPVKSPGIQSQPNSAEVSEDDNSTTTPPLMVTFNINENDMVLGNRNSSTVLVEYFSPTCSHCAYYDAKIFPQIKAKYIDTNKIAYVIREFIANKQDLDASILARCNQDLDSFLKFHQLLLQRQDSWAYDKKYRDSLVNIAKIGGISDEAYQKCLHDNDLAAILLANTNFIVKSPQFVGTPAFFINGKQLHKAYTVENLSQVLEEALKKNEPDTTN